MPTITTNAASKLPLAEQVATHFRELIQRDVLREGDLLPPADQITNASQPIVLQAYRQLQAEGLVRVRRAHGTIVTSGPRHQCMGILLRQSSLHGLGDSYRQSIVNLLMQRAVYHENAPRVYVMGEPADDIAQVLPPSMLGDLARNEICGVFVSPHKESRQVNDWLEGRQIPFVVFSHDQDGPLVTTGWDGLHRDGVQALVCAGCRRILVLSTGKTPPHQVEGVEVIWRHIDADFSEISRTGRQLADEWLQTRVDERPGGVVIPDDWMAISFYQQVRAAGIRIPGDLQLAVGGQLGQLSELFCGCHRLLIDPLEVVDEMIDLLMTRLAQPTEPYQTHEVPYRLQEIIR